MYSESENDCLASIDYDKIYKNFEEIPADSRQNLISDETARFTDPKVTESILENMPLKSEKNQSDDLMTLFEVIC